MHYLDLDNVILCFLSIFVFFVSILAIIFRERKLSQKQLVCTQSKNIEKRFEPRDGDSVRTR